MPLKIIHTADWHLGQTFMQKSRNEEHQLFLKWLLQLMDSEKIDAIIVAGDIFDVANPSIEALDLYHFFLKEAFKLNVEVIIIGGNHDSASRLNTTGSLLKLLNVHVVGGEAHALGEIIALKNKKTNEAEAIVVAIPYLRDGDVRRIAEGEAVKDTHKSFAESVKLHYDLLLQLAINEFPSVPIIGTAHLYVSGSTLSDPAKENMHAIGTLGQISSQCFSDGYHYIALGHIHKPQAIKHPNNTIVKYAGSPIPLSFSERDDNKEITLIEITDKALTSKSIAIEPNRHLKRFRGKASDLVESLKSFKSNTKLPAWAEIVVTERVNFLELNTQIETLALENGIEILNRTIDISNAEFENTRSGFVAGTDNNPLDNVKDIFLLRCEKSGLDEQNTHELMPLFEQVLNEIQNQERL